MGAHWQRPDMRGERHYLARLTAAQVLDIRAKREADPKRWTMLALAIEFDVGNGTITAILSGRTWKHLLPEGRHDG